MSKVNKAGSNKGSVDSSGLAWRDWRIADFWHFLGHGGWGHMPKPKPTVEVPELSLAPAYQPFTALFGDQTADKVFRLKDLNGDGDALDAGERTVFLDATNQSGLAAPTGNVFAIHQAKDGAVYLAEGDTDSVYVARDLNGDGDANDAGEAHVWFSKDNAAGLQLPTPNGVSTDEKGAVYVANAGLINGQTDDAIYRTVDLNNDGDANDAGEATRWIDLKTLNVSSSAFDLTFTGDVAYLADTNGGDTDTIYRLEDRNGNNVIDAGEAKVFISDNNAFGVTVDLAIAAQDGSVFTWDFSATAAGSARVFRLTDLNGSGDIDAAGEVKQVWDASLLPAGFGNQIGFSIAAGANGDVMVTSNSGDAAARNVVRLTDLNGDGDFLDQGETIIAVSNALDAAVGQRPRSVAFYDDGAATAHPNTYHEGGAAVYFAQGLKVSDADSKYLGGAVIKIAGGLDAGHDMLGVDLERYSGISASYDECSGTLTLKGYASVAEYQNVLQSLHFESRVDNPDEALRHVTITVLDERGQAGAGNTVATTIGVESDPMLTLFGTDCGDRITGHAFGEQILGGGGDDTITGKGGDDRLLGEEGHDYLRGGAGNDVLAGGSGYDLLEGGKGADHFLFGGESGTDIITDFDVFEDRIDFDGVTYKGQAIHSLAEADAAGAAHYAGHHTTIFAFDNNATLIVTEQHGQALV
ncbi:calcium-binding protein [Dongia sp.]|uniref:calcium-binding protein n=1 Tax=Dongia sp. TaxID=1977262 RepID=UPI0035ADAD05